MDRKLFPSGVAGACDGSAGEELCICCRKGSVKGGGLLTDGLRDLCSCDTVIVQRSYRVPSDRYDAIVTGEKACGGMYYESIF